MADTKERLVSLQTMYIKDASLRHPISRILRRRGFTRNKINLANTHDKIGDDSYDVCLKVRVESHTTIKPSLLLRLNRLVYLLSGATQKMRQRFLCVFS